MNWLRRHVAGISVLALIVALGALSLSLLKIWPAEEWWNVGANVILAISTVFLTCAAFQALHAWKAPEARKLAISLYMSTGYLEKVAQATCQSSCVAAGAAALIVSGTFASGLQEFGADDLPREVSNQRAILSDAKSKWVQEVDIATRFWGEEGNKAIENFRNLLDDLMEKMVVLEEYLFTLRLVVHGLKKQERSQYEGLKEQLEETSDKMQHASTQVSDYLKKYL